LDLGEKSFLPERGKEVICRIKETALCGQKLAPKKGAGHEKAVSVVIKKAKKKGSFPLKIGIRGGVKSPKKDNPFREREPKEMLEKSRPVRRNLILKKKKS